MDGPRLNGNKSYPRLAMPRQTYSGVGQMPTSFRVAETMSDELSVLLISNGTKEEYRLLPPGLGYWRR